MKIPIITSLSVLAIAGSSMAAAIAVNFSENNTNQNWLGTATNIGPLSTSSAYFNNSNNPTGGPANSHTGSLASGTIGNLVDDTGAAVASSVVTYSSSTAWYNSAGITTNNARLNVGYLDDGGSAVSIILSDIPYAQYDVYVLLASGQATSYTSKDFNINGDGFQADVLGYGYLGSEAANTTWTEATTTTRGNYIKLTGQTASTLTIIGQNRSGVVRGSTSGFIIQDTTPVPEPSSTALIGLGGLALILRRRK